MVYMIEVVIGTTWWTFVSLSTSRFPTLGGTQGKIKRWNCCRGFLRQEVDSLHSECISFVPARYAVEPSVRCPRTPAECCLILLSLPAVVSTSRILVSFDDHVLDCGNELVWNQYSTNNTTTITTAAPLSELSETYTKHPNTSTGIVATYHVVGVEAEYQVD